MNGEHRWFDVKSVVNGETAIFKMSADAYKIDGIRQSFSPAELANLCEELIALPPTPWLLDQRFLQADVRNEPAPKFYAGGIGMNTPQAILEHSKRVDVAVAGRGGSIGNVGKHHIWPLEHEQIYGWHLKQISYSWNGIKLYDAVADHDLKVIQRVSSAHAGPNDNVIDGYQDDYSMTGVVVHQEAIVGGKPTPTLSLYLNKSPFTFGPGLMRQSAPIRTQLGQTGPAVLTGQTWLKEKGYDPGPLDGKHGKRTEAAWLTYEARQAGARIDPVEEISFRQARYWSPGRPHGHVRWIVIHTAQNKEHESSAEKLQDYAATMLDGHEASWHEAIDCNSIAESVRPTDRAWAAGPANDWGYHIELVGYAEQSVVQWDDAFSRAQLAIAARRVAKWCKFFGIPVRWLTADELWRGESGICGHDTVTQASQVARHWGNKVPPWWHPIDKRWRTSSHVDPGLYFPRDRFIDAVNKCLNTP